MGNAWNRCDDPRTVTIERFLTQFVGFTSDEAKQMGPKIPKLDLCGRRGHTDYIDFLSKKDVVHTVMHGIDVFGRFFLVMKRFTGDKFIDDKVTVIFQRYSRDESVWIECGKGGLDVEDWKPVKKYILEAYQRLEYNPETNTIFRVDDSNPPVYNSGDMPYSAISPPLTKG